MKKFILLIIGILLTFIPTALETARADYCTLSSATGNYYKEAYCDMSEWGPFRTNDLNEEISDIVAEQWGFGDSGIVSAMLNNINETDCNLIGAYMLENGLDKEDLPSSLNTLCFKGGFEHPRATFDTQSAADFTAFLQGMKNSYDREKVTHTLEQELELEFKTSERFVDGSLSPLAPLSTDIDLIVDLNLIETILFGSRADWTTDVWQWPKEEEEEGGGAPTGPAGPGEGEEGTPPTGEEGAGVTITPEEPDALTNIMCGPPDQEDVDFPSEGEDGTRPVDQEGAATEEQPAEANMCKDPEAVFFQSPEAGAQEPVPAGQEPDPNHYPYGPNEGCPPGTYPRRGFDVTGPPPTTTPQYPQNPQYPGPNIGGTMKEFPPSNRPPCGPGKSEVKVTWITGGESAACIPSNWCADFNVLREKLFGKDCLKDKECSKTALSVEGIFCVELIKEDRPTSPYSSVEGCIDCHLVGIVDTLDKILEKNVAPMQNTMGTFAISNAFKPGLSMNLTVAVKNLVHLAEGYRPSPPEEVSKQLKQSEKDKETQSIQPQIPSGDPPEVVLERELKARREKVEARLDTYKNFRRNTKTLADQQLATRVPTLLLQMTDMFDGIQSQYAQLANIKLDKKSQCQLK